jgi:hypothetical protein
MRYKWLISDGIVGATVRFWVRFGTHERIVGLHATDIHERSTFTDLPVNLLLHFRWNIILCKGSTPF